MTPYIYAVETGLSSDPPMNWRLEQLDRFRLVSHSDAHSPSKLGREADIFDTELSYDAIYRALAEPDNPGFLGTIEFFPEEGKYHYDGHRKCATRLAPHESVEYDGKCPVCGKPVTVGVMARVEALADRDTNHKPAGACPYYNCIPLPEIIAQAEQCGPNTKKVQSIYATMLDTLGNEFSILRDIPIEQIQRHSTACIAEGIQRIRDGDVRIEAGYDGEYGTIKLFGKDEVKRLHGQLSFISSPEPEQRQHSRKSTGWQEKNSASAAHAATEDSKRPNEGYVDSLITDTYPASQIVAETPGGDRNCSLNTPQKEAIESTSKHLLIVAGPGTGKTHTLTHRICRLLETCASHRQIMAITFTNKAADEMNERIRVLVPDRMNKVFVGTFHRLCLSLLRLHWHAAGLPEHFSIATPLDVERFATVLWPELTVSKRRQRLDTIAAHKAGSVTDEYREAYELTAFIRSRGYIDFDDIILETVALLRNNSDICEQVCSSIEHICIDEYQDINAAQHALSILLTGKGAGLTAIGDPNQAIYGFRGSNSSYFGQFSHTFPDAAVLHLTHNYRSVSHILTASTQVIDKNGESTVPPLVATMIEQGTLTVYTAPTEKAEAEYVVHTIERMVGGTSMFSQDSGRVESYQPDEYGFGDIAVLYRLNSQADVLEEAFARSGIPFTISGARPFTDHAVIYNTRTLLRLLSGDSVHTEAAGTLIRFALSGIGEATTAALLDGTIPTCSFSSLVSCITTASLSQHTRATAGDFIDFCEQLKMKSHLHSLLSQLSTHHAWNFVLSRNRTIEKAWERLCRISTDCTSTQQFIDRISLYGAEADYRIAQSVSLCTLHAAKGLQFPVVFIVGCEDTLLPLRLETLQGEEEEERRLFYVGMTRAQYRCYCTRAHRRVIYGKTHTNAPSPFLKSIEESLKEYEQRQKRPQVQKYIDAEQMTLF
jgi:superfamily I DNA/RNA helicase